MGWLNYPTYFLTELNHGTITQHIFWQSWIMGPLPNIFFDRGDPGLNIKPPSSPNLPPDLGRHAGSGIQSPAGWEPAAPIAVMRKREGHLCHGEDDYEPWCFITTSTPCLPPHVVEQHGSLFQQGKPIGCSSPYCQTGRLAMWWTQRTFTTDWARLSAPRSWGQVPPPVDRAWSPSRAILQSKFYRCRAEGRFGCQEPTTRSSTPGTEAIQTSSCFSPSGALMCTFPQMGDLWNLDSLAWRLDRGQVSKRDPCGCTALASMSHQVTIVWKLYFINVLFQKVFHGIPWGLFHGNSNKGCVEWSLGGMVDCCGSYIIYFLFGFRAAFCIPAVRQQWRCFAMMREAMGCSRRSVMFSMRCFP